MLKRCTQTVLPVLLTAATALAQGADVNPPVPSDPGTPNKLVLYVVGGFLAILCIAFAIMPAQRSHHD